MNEWMKGRTDAKNSHMVDVEKNQYVIATDCLIRHNK